jgi:hypothetical protein
LLTITVPADLERLLVERAAQLGNSPEQVAFDAPLRGIDRQVSRLESDDAWIARVRALATPAGVSISNAALTAGAICE